MNYTITHLHSDISSAVTNIDSVTKFTDYIEQAKAWGMTAIAFTEHGSVMSWVKKKETCEKYGLKYIHATEAYLTESLDNKVRDNYHVCLYAKNFDGVKELNKMLSIANNRQDGHYHYVPRITFEELYATSDNIIIATACTGGVFRSENKGLKNEYIEFLEKNKHRSFLEVQHHNTTEQKKHNELILKLHARYNIPIIVATDTHALNETHIKGRDILQKAKNIHFKGEDGWDLVMRNYDEVVEALRIQGVLTQEQIIEGLENTNKLANMVEEFELSRSPKYPKLYENPLDELKKRINKGVKEKKINKKANYKSEYLPRIYEELETYIHNDAVDFLLLDSDIKDYARSNGVFCGYSRGSVSGSLIAYLIGMTDVDSVKFNMNFQRFMNKERISLADVDSDWEPNQRDFIKRHIYEMQGVYCADIITFNTIALKGAVKDVARALGYSVDIADQINKQIDANEKEMRNQYPDIFEYVDIINGTIVSIGSHPCGTVVSPIPLDENMGLCSLSTNENPITMLNMKEIDGLNYVKLDILGLDNIEIINETCKMAGIERLTPDNIVDDEKVWLDIRENTAFIFQWESDSAQAYLKQLFSDETVNKIKKLNPNFKYIDLFSVGNGAIRPAGQSYREELAKGIFHDNGHEALNNFMSPTLGYCIEENQRVSTVEGLKKIKDVNIGDVVYTENGTQKVVNKMYMGQKETIKIEHETGTLVCTPDHRILTENGWKMAKDISKDETIAHRVGCNNSQTYSKSHLVLLGNLLGDGMLASRNAVGFINKDLDIVNNFKENVEKSFPSLTCSILNRPSRVNKIPLYLANVKHVIPSKKDKEINNYLREVGLKGSIDKNKFVPDFIFKLDRECLLTFLGAYTDTDSTIKNNGYAILRYTTASKDLADGIQEIGRLLGYKFITDHYDNAYFVRCVNAKALLSELYDYSFKIRKTYEKEDLSLVRTSVCNVVSLKLIRNCVLGKVSTKKIHQQYGVNVSTKQKYINVDGLRRLDKDYPGLIPGHILNENIIWSKVKNVDNHGVANVYDLEIETEHNFTCEGVIVHNCVYQEQIINFLNQFCGFTMGEGDVVRKGFAKKLGTEQFIPRIKSGFIQTMKEKYNVTEEESERLIVSFLKVIEDASSYLFSLNHSLPYSYIGYACGYLRYYHPLEFITCALNNVMYKNTDTVDEKTEKIINYGINKGIKFEEFKFGYSKSKYVCDKETMTIYKGVKSIKYLNEKVSDELYELSKNNYNDPIELFIDVIERTSCNARQIKILIMLNFFSEFGEGKYLLNLFELINKRYDKKHKDKTKQARLEEIRNTEIVKEEFKPSEIIAAQKEYLGYATYKDEKYNPLVGVITDISNQYATRWMEIYFVKNGKTRQFKIKYSIIQELELKTGDMIYIKDFEKRPRKKLVNGKWVNGDVQDFHITNIVRV